MQKMFKATIAMMLTVMSTFLMPTSPTSAAIPCGELPVIPAPAYMVTTMIYIELPIDASTFLGPAQPVDREDATAASESDTGSAEMAAINQLRCLNYGMSSAAMGNSTPEFRVMTTNVKDPVEGEDYVDITSAHLVQYGDVRALADGRILIDYSAIINGERYFEGEMVFVENDGNLYLDSAALTEDMELGESHEIEISEKFTRETKVVEMNGGDTLRFTNVSEESHAEITIVDPSGDTIFVGNAMPQMMAGGETQNVFVAHNPVPGVYTVTIRFMESDVTMTVLIMVPGSPPATTVATPEG